jgi:hypothetical protein
MVKGRPAGGGQHSSIPVPPPAPGCVVPPGSNRGLCAPATPPVIGESGGAPSTPCESEKVSAHPAPGGSRSPVRPDQQRSAGFGRRSPPYLKAIGYVIAHELRGVVDGPAALPACHHVPGHDFRMARPQPGGKTVLPYCGPVLPTSRPRPPNHCPGDAIAVFRAPASALASGIPHAGHDRSVTSLTAMTPANPVW